MSAPASTTQSIDITPLSWVIEEVRQSLRRSATALTEFASNTADTAALERARDFLHQAHGALQIVDLEGIAVLTEHSERLLERYSQQPISCTTESARMLERIFDSLLDYLDDLLSGAPNQPVKLFPQYKELLIKSDLLSSINIFKLLHKFLKILLYLFSSLLLLLFSFS